MLNPVSNPVPFGLIPNPPNLSSSISPAHSPSPEPPSPANPPSEEKSYTIFIGDSLIKNLDSLKMSSRSQIAKVFSYPGGTSESILAKLKDDDTFRNLDPSKVKDIFVLCGANDVDNALSIPRQFQSDNVDSGDFWVSEHAVNNAKYAFTRLVDFIHNWAKHAIINVVNLLPRASFTRNQVINLFNYHIVELSHSKNFVKFVSTELDRNLFTFRNGFRKSDFFSFRGDDNVHLNSSGLIRLAKHLKYFAHNN